jgi:hypothetical protein
VHGEYKVMFWLFVGIITLTFVLPLLSAWIVAKVMDLAKAHPKPAKYTLITMFIILMVAGGLKIRDIYYEKSPYYFWNELMRKNPKPFNVSQQEFEAKNRAGYCWRDKKYYSKEELWHKAMKSLTGRMLYENKLYWDNEVIDAGGNPRPTAADCIRYRGCRVLKIPMSLINQEISKDNIETKNSFWKKIDRLINNKKVQSYKFASDENYINDDFELNNFVLIHQLDDRIPTNTTLYSSNCCSVLSKAELSLIKNKYKLKYAESDMGTFLEESRIPIDIDINSWGVGNFYLGVTSSYYFDIVNFEERDESGLPEDIFILNNCGDILYKPYYD